MTNKHKRKCRIGCEEVSEAWLHWCKFNKLRPNCESNSLQVDIFFDFLDPARTTDMRDVFSIDSLGLYSYFTQATTDVLPQIARRIDLLCGPHWYAILKANQQRVEKAKHMWGRSRRVTL